MPGPTPPAHLRLTMAGTLGAVEQFSMSLSLRPDTAEFRALVDPFARAIWVRDLLLGEPMGALFDDIVDDCTSWFSAAECRIRDIAHLTTVKLASIDDDGHYNAPPREAAVSVFGGSLAGGAMALQISRKVTFLTAGDIGRVKGGFYIPAPSTEEFDAPSDQWTSSSTESVENRTRDLVDDLNNAPGIDVHAFKVVVASAGRHNPDGSVRVPAQLHDVTAVSVGRRADVQRRRANKVPEARSAPSNVA